MNTARVAVVLAAATSLLAGCSTVSLVSDYDDQIDSGLTQVYSDTSGFVDRMVAAAGSPAGTYEVNKDFYRTEEGKLDALVVRARAHQALNSCPSIRAVGKAITTAVPQNADVKSALSQVPDGDCEVTLLTLTRAAYTDFEKFHQAQGSAGIPASAKPIILEGGVGALLRAGITVEIAKKSNKTGSSK